MPPDSYALHVVLIVFHTKPFEVTLSKVLVHYYYMPQASNVLSIGIAIIPSYKFKILALTAYVWQTQLITLLNFWEVACKLASYVIVKPHYE